jgi:aminobenzoyl-glutamate utilization protein B
MSRDICRLVSSLLLLATLGFAQSKKPAPADPALAKKQEAVALVEKQQSGLIKVSDEIWGFAETALREKRSAKAMADYAEQQGFTVERGAAEMPTAFVASYGSGSPIIGILGEYDALPGISQKASSAKEALVAGAPGHGCGHNLLGSASMGAAVAIKQMIEAGKLKGTIRYYGTPAEEAIGGKVYMVKAGLFKDVDIVLAWHPATENQVDTAGGQAIVDMLVEFKGKASHAAFDPWNGRSAVDGLEAMTHGLNMMREHIQPTGRIHYVIMKGGDVPNVVPEYAKLWLWLRDTKRERVDEMLARVQRMAQGAGMIAGVEAKLTVQAGDYERLVNMTGERALYQNMEWLGPVSFTAEEQAFAKQIQANTGVPQKGLLGEIQKFDPDPPPEGGSTDVGDVSWNVPTLHFSATTAADGAPWHGWPVVATSGMSIGHKGMMYAAKVLAATAVDLYEKPALRDGIKKEFAEQTKGFVYKPYVPDGPPPVPKD